MNELLHTIPGADPLPVASGWFLFLSYLTYYLHLIAVGIMFGTGVSMTLGYFKAKREKQWIPFAVRMSKILPFSIAFAINLGVAPLLFIQVLYGNFFYTASILVGIPWLLLILLLIFAYYSAYWLIFKKEAAPAAHAGMTPLGRKPSVALFITIILAWTGFMLVNVNTLMMTPAKWHSYFNHMSGFHLNLSETTLFPRYIFYLFLLLCIGGMFIAIFYKIKDRLEESGTGFHYGCNVSGAFALFSLPAFVLYLFMLPGEIRGVFLGGSGLWTAAAALFVLGLLAVGILGMKKKAVPAALLLTLDLVVFVFTRNHIRYLYLKPFEKKFPVLGQHTQYGVMVLFFAVLAAGLGLVAWILIKTAKETRVLNSTE